MDAKNSLSIVEGEPAFGVLLIAVEDYPEGKLPSCHSAALFEQLVTSARGGKLIEELIVARTVDDVQQALDRWIARNDGPSSTIVYLVGHGESTGRYHTFLLPKRADARYVIQTRDLANDLNRDWQRRDQYGGGDWTLFILDCCASDDGVANIEHELTELPKPRPARYELWPVTPGGASHNGEFVARFADALTTFNEHDTSIPLHDVFRRIGAGLGDLEPKGRPSGPRRAREPADR
jgi:hypothetical protein